MGAAAQSMLRHSLKDEVLGLLSDAAIKGTERIKITDFYRAFAQLAEQYPNEFPPMVFTRAGNSAYSKRLDSAVQSLVGYSVNLPNPQLQYLELSRDTAERHMDWLRETYGEGPVRELSRLGDVLLRELERVNQPHP